MTNRVPPLHPASPPPFHPDSPPPFGKFTSYEDDADEIDDFGEYIAETPDLGEEFHRGSPEVVTLTNVTAVETDVTQLTSGVNTLGIDEVISCVCDEECDISIETQNGISHEHEMKTVEKISADKIGESNINDYVHYSLDNNVEKNKNFEFHDHRNNVDIEDSSTFSETEEPTSLKISENDELATESSDDSSATINEAAFVLPDCEREIGEDNVPDDSLKDVSSSKNDDYKENVDLKSEVGPSDTEINFEKDRSNSSLSKTISVENTETIDNSTVADSSRYDTVTIDHPEVKHTTDVIESSSALKNFGDFSSENDDFDDFVSPPTYETQSPKESINENENEVLKADELNTLDSEVDDSNFTDVELWKDIFPYKGEDPIEVNINTLESKLNASSVWCKLKKNMETCPVLNFNWNDSESKKMLLITLGIDSRNILFGPRWNSEVPRFASNLGLSPLVPQKASADENNEPQHSYSSIEEPAAENPEENSHQVVTSIEDAHFDWTGSGLTNPLGTRKLAKITKESTDSKLEYNLPTVSDNASDHGLSPEAAKILNNLPDLLVMEKQYIVFPIR